MIDFVLGVGKKRARVFSRNTTIPRIADAAVLGFSPELVVWFVFLESGCEGSFVLKVLGVVVVFCAIFASFLSFFLSIFLSIFLSSFLSFYSVSSF